MIVCMHGVLIHLDTARAGALTALVCAGCRLDLATALLIGVLNIR